jgi:ribosomal protein S18 acetylase RimI-like enzyme
MLKNGQALLIRKLKRDDAKVVIDYMNIVNLETKNLLREPDEFTMTVEEEADFLEKRENSANDVMYGGFVNHQLVSIAGFYGSQLKRIKHRVTIGMSVLKAYHGLGIGSFMMETLIKAAKDLGKMKMELDVRVDNEAAIALYKKYGFVIEGTLSNAIYVDQKMVDLYVMGLHLLKD